MNLKKLMLLLGVLYCGSPAFATDCDEDGLDDALEQSLIDTYRPYYYYDGHQGTWWPSSVDWYVRRCRLLWNGQVVYSNAQIECDPLLILEGGAVTGASSNAAESPAASAYALAPVVSIGDGQGPNPVGTYAHVVRIGGPVVYINRECCPVGAAGDIVIQYWQFFPYNDSQAFSCCYWFCGPCHPGDHEGDWLYLDVFVDGQTHALKNIVYHHHGDGNCAVSILPGDRGECPNPLPLPADGIPKCYLEEGSHEWWPAPCNQDCSPGGHQDSVDGAGVQYRTQNVINLGERFAPMPHPEAQMVVLFNGRWGAFAGAFATPADGPMYQAPPGFFNVPTIFSAPRLFGSLPFIAYASPLADPNYNGPELGLMDHPFSSAQAAMDGVATGGTVRFDAGNYPGQATTSRPMILTAPNGPVTIGR